jgi:CxxC motif-containing protein (DUF1111 family)
VCATLAIAFLASSGGNALRAQTPPNFTQGHAFLGIDDQARFEEGLEEFSAVETADDGVGPIFNDNSCAACHTQGGIGGGSTVLETRFGKITNGVFDPLSQFGGSLQQLKGIGDLGGGCNFFSESILGGANVVARRRTQPLFGLGLVDATAESTFQQIANAQPVQQRGRMNRVLEIVSGQTRMGKFGWKAQVPTLFQFSADAYLNEMGITSPQFPNESCPNGDCALVARCNPVPTLNDDGDDVELFRDFMVLLAAPPRGPINSTVTAGEGVFNSIGCATCHVASITTSPSAAEPSLRNRTYHPYSDFLLHDMGSLGDNIGAMGVAGLREMRTQPLWGLRVVTRFLHDGRADTISRAVENHAGQAVQARDRFNNLPATQKTQILAFLNSL